MFSITRLSSVHWLVGVLAVVLGVPTHANEEVCMDPASFPGPKIGLVLGGGGARGAAHIGVIRRLEELRVPVYAVGGTSMGSLVGGFYATGMNAAELESTVKGIDFEELFKDATKRQEQSYRRKRDDDLALYGPKLGVGKNSELLPRGAVHGQKISYLFETLTSARTRERDFDKLPIPYRAVASDIVTGEAVVLREGSLSLAMRSSMSVPGVFDPVVWGDHLLVDGGIANNLPIDVVRGLGPEVIIAVEVGTPPAGRENLQNMADFVGQLTNLMISNNTKAQIATLGPDDVLIRPALGDEISSAGFDRASDAIAIGYEAALQASDALARYSVSEAEYARYRQKIESCIQGPTELQFVQIENRSRFSDEVIQKRMDIEPGEPVEPDTLKNSVERVYGLGFLDLVRHEVVERDGQTGALVTVDQDARGTNFLEWGIDLQGDGDDTSLDLRVGYLKTDLDEYGSELRLLAQIGDTPAIMAELYKALGPELRWFLRPKAGWENREYYIFNEAGNPQEQITVRQTTGEFAIARELGDRATLWGGLRYYEGQSDDQLGTLPETSGDYQGGEYVFGYDYDGIDDRYFPRDGMLARLSYSSSQDTLGADEEFDQLRSVVLGVRSFGRHTLLGRIRYNTTLDGISPYYTKFRAGGLFELSGLAPDQIGGDHYGIAMASWRYELLSGRGFFPAQAGISLEYGNAADDRDDILDDAIKAGSLYFGYSSPIGPLYWGVGFAEGGEKSYFLRIGDVFTRSAITR